MLDIILRVLLLSVAIFFIAQFMPGIRLKNFGTAVLVAVVYSVINLLLFRILVFLTFPLMFITFGLFSLVINAALLWLTDKLIEDFEIQGLRNLLLATVLISVSNWLIRWIL